jgi:hypothetical protein
MLPKLTLPEPSAPPLAAAPTPARKNRGGVKHENRVTHRKPDHSPKTGAGAVDLLAVTPERIARALWRSFLRYGITEQLDAAVHSAMNVVGPVLEARDAEILRLNQTLRRMKPPPGRRAAPSSRTGRQ